MQRCAELEQSKAITPEYARLLRTISASTTSPEQSIHDKVMMALTLSPELAQTNFAKGKVVYPGAGLDWQFPLALGARTLEMADIDFSNKEIRQRAFRQH